MDGSTCEIDFRPVEAELKRLPRRLRWFVERYVPAFLPDIRRDISRGKTGYFRTKRYIRVQYMTPRKELLIHFELFEADIQVKGLDYRGIRRVIIPSRDSIRCAQTKVRAFEVVELVERQTEGGIEPYQVRHAWLPTGHFSKKEKWTGLDWLEKWFSGNRPRTLH